MPGLLLGPFQSDSGWVLLKVEDRRKQPPPTRDASRPQIVRFLTYAQVGDLLKTLRGKGRVQLLTGPSAAGQTAAPSSAPAKANDGLKGSQLDEHAPPKKRLWEERQGPQTCRDRRRGLGEGVGHPELDAQA